MLPALPIIAGMLSGAGSLIESKEKEVAFKQEAAAAESNALLARQVAKYNAEKFQLDSDQLLGQMKAGYSASGVDLESGSVLESIRASKINQEMDRLNILHGGDVESALQRNQAAAARAGAKRSKQLGYFSAFTNVFGGLAGAAGGRTSPKATPSAPSGAYSARATPGVE